MAHPKTAELALAFSTELRQTVSPREIEMVIESNRANMDTQSGVGENDATYDMCDADAVMSEAFKMVMGRAAVVSDKDDFELWSSAWTMAKDAEFAITPPVATAPHDEPNADTVDAFVQELKLWGVEAQGPEPECPFQLYLDNKAALAFVRALKKARKAMKPITTKANIRKGAIALANAYREDEGEMARPGSTRSDDARTVLEAVEGK